MGNLAVGQGCGIRRVSRLSAQPNLRTARQFRGNCAPIDTYLNSLERVDRSTVVAHKGEQPATGKGGDDDRFEHGKYFIDRLRVAR